jgi:hypothetical protein
MYYRIFTALLNSTYSLWWDIFRDWDLGLISAHSTTNLTNSPQPNNRQPPRLIFGLTPKCYAIVLLDALLRFTWLVRFSLQLDIYEFQERTVFVLEMLEVLRRWMWLLFRAETEWLRKRGENIELSIQMQTG